MSAICRLLRIDWDTVGRIVQRVCADELDPDRLSDLFDVGIDEVSWKRQHNYLTLIADHRSAKIVWGCKGVGEKAADAFFAELDPDSPRAAPPPSDDAARQHRIMPPDAHRILSVCWGLLRPDTRTLGEEPRRGDEPVVRVRGC